ncbi:DUF6086 family protein [Streptomyces sp. NPDC048288]|uniref:DUF6086 family protein n=1 Tax=Streptomyces sp. NPDC048288 TaxID=3365529 RepID=UPI00371F3BFB
MSYIFDVGDDTVWSPSLRVGEWYVSLVESAARVLGCPHGLRPVANDMYVINPEDFEGFTRLLQREYFSTDHSILRVQLRGTLLTSMVLLERAGVCVNLKGEEQRDLLLEAQALGRSMAR